MSAQSYYENTFSNAPPLKINGTARYSTKWQRGQVFCSLKLSKKEVMLLKRYYFNYEILSALLLGR
jgi:hypothetical protein